MHSMVDPELPAKCLLFERPAAEQTQDPFFSQKAVSAENLHADKTPKSRNGNGFVAFSGVCQESSLKTQFRPKTCMQTKRQNHET
jgi:hypothetical protein